MRVVDTRSPLFGIRHMPYERKVLSIAAAVLLVVVVSSVLLADKYMLPELFLGGGSDYLKLTFAMKCQMPVKEIRICIKKSETIEMSTKDFVCHGALLYAYS